MNAEELRIEIAAKTFRDITLEKLPRPVAAVVVDDEERAPRRRYVAKHGHNETILSDDEYAALKAAGARDLTE